MKPIARGGDFWRIFGVPTLLALASAVGLLSALLGDDLWDGLSWLMLGAPIAVVMLCVARPARRRRA
jgi:hypothetical protein